MIAEEEGLLTTLVLSIYDQITAVCAESQTFEKRFFLTMTLYQFNALDEMEQAEAVWSGVHFGGPPGRKTQYTSLSNRFVLCRGLLQ